MSKGQVSISTNSINIEMAKKSTNMIFWIIKSVFYSFISLDRQTIFQDSNPKFMALNILSKHRPWHMELEAKLIPQILPDISAQVQDLSTRARCSHSPLLVNHNCMYTFSKHLIMINFEKFEILGKWISCVGISSVIIFISCV